MMKTKLAQLLLLSMIAASVTACGGEGSAAVTNEVPATDTAAAVETEEAGALDGLAVQDFGGHTFGVLATNDAANNRHYDIATAGEENGDILNDLVYARNRAVEEKYNITITTADDEYAKVMDTIRQQVQGGLTDYELYLADGHATMLAAEGYFADMNAISTLDLSQPWWNQKAVSALSIEGKVYFSTGDINPTTMMSGGGLVFNKSLFSDNDIAYPYDTVREGKWTIDAMLSLTKDMSQDIDGDGSMSPENDRYSMSSWCAASPFAFFYGMGGMMSKKGSDDIPVLDWDVDRISAIYEDIYTLIIGQKSYFVTDGSKYDTNFKCFSDGHAFFNQISLLTIDRNLRDMEDDYGIVPIPKFDEAQKDYLAYVNAASNLAMIPSSAEDPERAGLLTDALAAGAYDMVTPSLYEIITKSRNVRDEESAEMVSIITSNIVYDTFYLNLLDGYSILQERLTAKSESIASALESKRTAAEKSLEKLVEAYKSMN